MKKKMTEKKKVKELFNESKINEILKGTKRVNKIPN